MTHPTITDWADFSRAVADTGDRAAMQSHLDGGCAPCRAVVAALERTITTAAVDSIVAPPAKAVRSVKAIFDQHREPWPFPDDADRIRLRLRLDN